MSLATRCPACGTVFRLQQEQLAVSDGWVRCGRCAEVFNAEQQLVDLSAMSPRGVGGRTPPRTAPVPTRQAPPPAPDLGARQTPAPPAYPVEPQVAAPLSPRDDTPVRQPDDGPDLGVAEPVPAAAPATGRPETAAAAAEAPSFVRQAERAARWRRPGVRLALLLACVLAGLLLAGQAAHTWRDLLAARWPALQPWLARACVPLGCTIAPPLRIDAWVVEGSALQRLDRSPEAGQYRLGVSLRHRAGHTLAVPAIDLTLTDARGGVIARRVLHPADLSPAPPALAAGSLWAAEATLQVREGEVASYTIELFHP